MANDSEKPTFLEYYQSLPVGVRMGAAILAGVLLGWTISEVIAYLRKPARLVSIPMPSPNGVHVELASVSAEVPTVEAPASGEGDGSGPEGAA